MNLEYSWLLPKFWMCGRLCDFGNCRAGGAALPVAGVINSIAGAWANEGKRPPAPFIIREQYC